MNDTFTTVDALMDEFPTFHFSQSQTSVYQILKDYLPWHYETVKAARGGRALGNHRQSLGGRGEKPGLR